MIHLLTATGCRPEAWSICEQLMARQNYAGAVHWVVVDDGEVKQPITFARSGWTIERLRVRPYWRPGINTQARNLLQGFEAVPTGERLIIIEDDDWYSPNWISRINDALDQAELVGESRSRYYNLQERRGRQLHNSRHASLCATAMKGNAFSSFLKACNTGQKFIDIRLWKTHQRKMLFEGNDVVGIKGLPGRPGIGMGHGPGFRGTIDSDLSILRDWIGNDLALYEKYLTVRK